MKYYLDTCVWIAYFNEKEEQHEIAVKLFEKIRESKDIILVSHTHIIEMRNKNKLEEFNTLKDKLYYQGLCVGVITTELDRQIAYKHNEKEKLGYGDCVHLQVAKRENAIPVSFDQDWQDLGEKMQFKVYLPEEIIT